MTTNEVLRLTNLSCRRSRFDNAADALSLTVNPGEYQTLATAPGSEATYLIPLIAGEVKLVSGSGTLFGYPLQKMSARRRRRLLQQTGILPRLDATIDDLTLEEFLAIPLRISGVAAGQIGTRVRNCLGENELLLQKHQLVSALASPHLRLASLAQALIKSPKLIIAELRDDQFDRLVIAQILHRYASHGGAVLALVDGVSPAQLATEELAIGSEANAAF